MTHHVVYLLAILLEQRHVLRKDKNKPVNA